MTTRDVFVENVKNQIDTWNAEITKFEATVDAAQADAKVKLQEQLEEMQKQREKAVATMQEMQHASEEAWDEMRKGSEDAWSALTDAFKRAHSKFDS